MVKPYFVLCVSVLALYIGLDTIEAKHDTRVRSTAAVAVPDAKQLAFMDTGISQFLCFNIDPWGSPHVEHNCVAGPPCLSPQLFQPTALDTDQWVAAAAAMGATELVLTAHHEGGFCLWPSHHSNYTVAQTPWGAGGGDVVKMFVDSCAKAGVKASLYWGPNANGHLTWSAVDATSWMDAQIAQLRELLTNYGPIARLWWDHYDQARNAGNGSLAPSPRGLFPDAWLPFIQEARRLSPATIICPGPDCTGHLGEGGTGAYPVWYACDSVNCTADNSTDCGCALASHGARGAVFKPLETCSTPYVHHQWFAYGSGDGQVAWTVKDFWKSWISSVGIGYVNTANSAPGTTGQAQKGLVEVQTAFGKVLEPLHLDNAIAGAFSPRNPPPKFLSGAKGVRQSQSLRPQSMSAPCASAVFELDLAGNVSVGAVVLREDLTGGQRIARYTVEYADHDGSWLPFSATDDNVTFLQAPNTNNVDGADPPAPGGDTHSITFAGDKDSWEACEAACAGALSCSSFTYVESAGGPYGHNCFLRNDTVWRPKAEAQHYSGFKKHTSNGVHGLSIGNLLVDVVQPTETTKIRWRCLGSLQDPVTLRSFSAHTFVPPH